MSSADASGFVGRQSRTVARALSLTFLLLLLSALLPEAMAQVDRGGVVGRITDRSGAVIPKAHIAIASLESGASNEALSDDTGFYAVRNLPAGLYKLTVEMKGFKTADQPRFAVPVAQTIRIDVLLETGEIQETISITSDLALLRSEDSLLATAIEGAVIRNLPLTISGGRLVESFAYALSPAVEGNGWSSHIAGAPAFTKEVLIDGLSATSQIQGNVFESSPTMESIQAFSIQTGGLSAEYGHAGGGVFNFALAHGTNTFNGGAYYLGRNEALNANTWMNNWQKSQDPRNPLYQRARDRQLVFGGSAGGPVFLPGLYDGRSRTLIFGAFEHFRQQQTQVGALNRTVPIPEFLDGDFSRLLTTTEIARDVLGRAIYAGQIFDPLTMRRVGSSWVSDPFPNNRIPLKRMSAVSGRVIDLFRAQYKPMIEGVLTNNSAGPQYESPWFHQSQLTLKVDHTITPALKLTGSLIWTERPRILLDQGGIWDPLAPEAAGGPLARARKQEVTSRALRLTANWNISPNVVGTGSFVYNRYRNPSLSAQADGKWQYYLGLQGSTGSGLFPEISFGSAVNGIKTTDVGYGSSNYSVAENFVTSGTVDWIHGSHSIKIGGEFWGQQMNSHAGLDTLNFGFSSTQTGIPGYSWSNRTGFGFASFFLGEAESGSKTVPFDLYGRRKYVGIFFQDNYRVRNAWTLNMGLRWEQPQPLREKYGRWASFNPELKNTNLNVAGALEFLDSPGDTFEKVRDWKEFGPRIGTAYRFNSRFVARAGYGISFIAPGMNYWSGVPYGFAPGYRGTNLQKATQNLPRFNWDSGYPDNYQAPSKDSNSLVYGMVSIDPRSLFSGYVHQYNFGVQFEPGRDTIVEAVFMGNQGRRLHNGSLRRNQPRRESYENPLVDPWAWVWDADSASAAGVAYPYAGFSNFAGVALQPYPHIASETGGPVYFAGTPAGSSGYKALHVSVTRRSSSNMSFQLSYSLSRAVGNAETGFDETWDPSGGIQDMYDLSESARTVVSYDQKHIFKGQISMQLPFGKGRRISAGTNRILNSVISGWNITGIFRYNSGNPLAVYSSVWYPGWEGAVYANFDPHADLNGQFDSTRFNPKVQNAPANRYFNPTAFSNPGGHQLGNGKRFYAELRGFGYANEDLGLIKNLRIAESSKLQLRAEFLNVFNRHHFADPNTNLGNATTFGYVTTVTGTPRVVQFGVRMEW